MHYDDVNIYLYDSLKEIPLHAQELHYINLRFPQVKTEDIIIKDMITVQPDMYSCGIYSGAFIESIISGKNPSTINYSSDTKAMRAHFFDIIVSGISPTFPHHEKYEDVPGIDFGNNNDENQMHLNLINANIDTDWVILGLLRVDEYVYDKAIQLILEIIKKFSPDFEIYEVQHFRLRKLLRPLQKEKHLQIIGGVSSDHWMCLYYDGTTLSIFDSIYKGKIELYGEQEKRYIQKRYKGIDFNKIVLVPVTN